MRVSRLKCKKCPNVESVDPDVLREEISTRGSFVDFVCPACGYGERQPIPAVEELELHSQDLLRANLFFHESFLCKEKSCTSHGRVHSVKVNEEDNAKPKKSVREWRLVGILCLSGHPLEMPLRATADDLRTTNIDTTRVCIP
jgi:hypothetical protein